MAQEVSEVRRNKRLRSQTRKIIMNVYNYFRDQDEQESETDVDLRIAAATGISVRSLHTIKQQHRRGGIKSPPPRTRISPVLGSLDDFAKDSIRQEIFSFYERDEIPTVEALLKRVKEPPVNFSGAYSSLYRVVKQLGFRYKRIDGGRYILLERSDVAAARNKYLRAISGNRKSRRPRPEIYLDETWINENECLTRGLKVNGFSGPKLKKKKGARYFIMHAGGEDGFVPGALFFQSKTDTEYVINHTRFQTWFERQLLPNIPAHSLIVMDNAWYHSKILNKAPASNSNKCEIIQWLTEHNIAHDPTHTKFELLHLANCHRNKQVYEIDEVALNAGHEVLRLPLYHCQFNPMEFIWTQVKNDVKKNIAKDSQTLYMFHELTKDAIDRITAEDWKKALQYTRQVEQELIRKEEAFDYQTENFVINDDSSDSDTDE
ncbi:uncharacterized protein LOC122267665 [Penaeus japonicus]|uniref:uncharacterized protein LOC122267665 n=1 Tax=Penaeus japonicus TaxID=27405 RepID=UPI001C70E22C|nr:uncharacterized protein LOC122267665 [Penaeus japonicus]